MKYLLLSVWPVLLLSGCFAAKPSLLVTQNTPYDPSAEAKLRLYGPYGDTAIKSYADTTCEAWRQLKGGRTHTRFKNGLPRKIRNISVGMPTTQRSAAANADTGAVFRDSYKESVVGANKPLVLDGSQAVTTSVFHRSCRVAVSFVPVAGQNYEAAYETTDTGCAVSVHRITAQKDQNGLPVLERVPVQACPKPGTSI